MLANENVNVHDVELALVERGEGRRLLFLHGEDGLIWSEPLIEALAKDFRVTAPDHPAWGKSTRPRHITEVRDIASVYGEFLEGFEEPFLVVGCSFGAWVAAELAIASRVPLAGLVLAAPTGIKLGEREERDFADIWMADFPALLEILYGDPSRAPDLTALSDEEYLYLAVAQEATARYCWRPYMHDPKLRHRLRRITAPTLLLAGEADRFALRPDYYERYAELVGPSGAELRTIPGAGHRVEEEAPDELAELIVQFSGQAAGLAASSGGN